MRYTELNLFGVFVSPMAVMLMAAWLALQALRRVAVATGMLRHVWHPALASVAIYVIVLSAVIILAGS